MEHGTFEGQPTILGRENELFSAARGLSSYPHPAKHIKQKQ